MIKDYLNRLERLDSLIRRKGTGNPKELARKLQISERSVYCYLEILKELGAPIKYSKQKRSYYYELDGSISFKFSKK